MVAELQDKKRATEDIASKVLQALDLDELLTRKPILLALAVLSVALKVGFYLKQAGRVLNLAFLTHISFFSRFRNVGLPTKSFSQAKRRLQALAPQHCVSRAAC